MHDLTRTRFAVDRLLAVSPTLDQLKANDRFTTLIKARGSRPLTLTVLIKSEDDRSTVLARLLRLIEGLTSQETVRQLDVRLADCSESVGILLQNHDALLTSGMPDDHPLIINAWQHGLCVVNSIDQ